VAADIRRFLKFRLWFEVVSINVIASAAKQSSLSELKKTGLLRRIRLRAKADFVGQECSSQ
jgi:hypothetical protein